MYKINDKNSIADALVECAWVPLTCVDTGRDSDQHGLICFTPGCLDIISSYYKLIVNLLRPSFI